MDLRRQLLRRTLRAGLLTALAMALALSVWTLHDTRREVAATRALVSATVAAVIDAQQAPAPGAQPQVERPRPGGDGEIRHVTMRPVPADQPVVKANGDWLDRLVDARIERIELGAEAPSALMVGTHAASELAEHLAFAAAAFAALLAFGLAVAWVQYRTLVAGFAPVEVFAQRLRDFEAGRHDVRLPDPPVTELAPVARAFNRLADSLAATAAEQQRLSRELLSMREDERRRIARELHDDVGQSVTALAVHLALLRRDAADPVQAAALAGLDEDVQRLRSTTRAMLDALRAGDDGQLPAQDPAALVTRWRALQPGIRWALDDDVDEQLQRLTLPVYRAACRILQEAFTNAVRHAHALTVTVRAEPGATPDDAPVALVIDNDGCTGEPQPPGNGLTGMRERAESVGASLTAGPLDAGRWRVRLAFPEGDRP